MAPTKTVESAPAVASALSTSTAERLPVRAPESLPVRATERAPVRVSPHGLGPLPYEFAAFLPAIYQGPDGEFLQRYLRGLETLWVPLETFLADVSVLYDTRRTPSEFLPWLASWVGLTLRGTWGERERRELIRRAVELYQWRGTIQGLSAFLEIYTGVRPQITEPFEGSPFGFETVIGRSAVIGDVPEHCFVVTVFISEDRASQIEEIRADVRAILDAEKPAHTAYDLRTELRRAPQQTAAP